MSYMQCNASIPWSNPHSSTPCTQDLYHALEAAAGLAAGSEEQRVVEVVLAKLRHVGAHLPEAQRKELEEPGGWRWKLGGEEDSVRL